MNKDEEEYKKIKDEIIKEVTKLRKKIIKLKPEYQNRLFYEIPEMMTIIDSLIQLRN